MCRLFPLSLTFLPEGEICANLLRCEAVNDIDGNVLDEKYVQMVIDEISSLDTDFFNRLKEQNAVDHIMLTPLLDNYSLIDFESKILVRNRLAELLISNKNPNAGLRLRIHALFQIILALLPAKINALRQEMKLPVPTIFTRIETSLLPEKLTRDINCELANAIGKTMKMMKQRNEKITKKGIAEIYWDDGIKKVYLNEKLSFRDPFGNVSEITARDLVFEKNFTSEVEELVLCHLSEILRRIDLGIPLYASIPILLGTIDEYMMSLQSYCQFYAQNKSEIDQNSVTKAIKDLDTSLLVLKIYSEKSII